MATAVPELPSLARDRAFETLYHRYVKDVYRYSLALLRNPADAEDVTQTTFMNAYRAYKRGEEIEKPQNWLIKIAHNAARTRYARASRRVREVPLDDHVDRLAVSDDDKPDVREVLDALGRLPLNQRAALVMRELEGRTYAEIADTLGVSVPAVETLIFRARRSLRLRASAVRVLTAVQLPASLSQLWEASGGAVASGTALVGTGFLVKAAIAIVVGAVATGVSGSAHPRSAAAAALQHGALTSNGNERALTSAAPSLVTSMRVAARSVDTAGRLAVIGLSSHRTRLPDEDVRAASAPVTGSTTAAAPSSPNTSQPAARPGPTDTATGTVSPVTSTVVGAAPPVAVPQLPPVPVTLPPPPPVPPLP